MTTYSITVCLSLFVLGEAFILNSNTSATGSFTAHTSQQLFDLPLEEKQLRHQLENYVAALEQEINANEAALQRLHGGPQIGFSAQGNIQTLNVLRFNSVKTNVGYGYSYSTGALTCSHSGLYYFFLSLIKERSSSGADMVYCYIRKNGIDEIYTRIDPNDANADYGSYGTSTSLVIHLSVGDKVDVGGCSGSGTVDSYSTFKRIPVAK